MQMLNYMPRLNKVCATALNQRGVIQLVVLLILLLGLVGGVLLVTRGEPLKFLPKAGGGVSGPINPETSFTLIGPNGCAAGFLCTLQFIMPPEQGEEFSVKLYARSDIEEANLFTAKINFPKDIVEVKEIRMESRFNQVENFYDNNSGEISIVGGVPAPGLRTQIGEESALMAAIIFRAKAIGKGTVSFTDASAIYSNLNNIDILTIKRPYDISVEVKPSATPIASPTPSATPLPQSPSYRRVFVTSTTYTGNLGGLSGADAKCQARADAANLGGIWKAWLSSSTEGSPSTRFIKDTGPYKNILGNVIANSWSDLTDQALENSLAVNENGALQNITEPWNVWTNTWTSGSIYDTATNLTCDNWTSDSSSMTGRGGASWKTDFRWTASEISGEKCNTLKRLYCFEQASAASTPIPGTGDGNNDGKINLADMSVLLTDFNKEQGFRSAIDMNGDGKINTFDFSLMRNLLIQKGVIRG